MKKSLTFTPPEEMKILLNEGKIEEAIFLGIANYSNMQYRESILHYLGDAFHKKGDMELSISFYKKALSINRNRPWTLHNLAKSLETINNKESIKYFEELLLLRNEKIYQISYACSPFLNLEKKKDIFLHLFNKDPSIVLKNWNLGKLKEFSSPLDLQKKKMRERAERWFDQRSKVFNPEFSFFSQLANKNIGRNVAKILGIRVPEIYACGDIDFVFNSVSTDSFV
ncbi:MAG: tetratricopeptide repeat protein, partial [Lachnospiraceae bacterium]|nr:tetratricopeptide repeat protein [Lachnospiraceae bacterium]